MSIKIAVDSYSGVVKSFRNLFSRAVRKKRQSKRQFLVIFENSE